MKRFVLFVSIFAMMSLLLVSISCQSEGATQKADVSKAVATQKLDKDAKNNASDKSGEKLAAATAAARLSETPDKVVVYYFHGDFRCPTCTKMQELSEQAIKGAFATQLASGKLEFKEVNTDHAENAHFKKDYELYTKSLVMVAYKDGKQLAWKNCEKIWELVRNPVGFISYVQDEIRSYLGE